MRKFLILLVILILAGAGAGYYYFWGKTLRLDIWDFVPDTSIAVFQPTDLRQLFSDKEERKILNNLHTIPEIKKLVSELSSLDSLAKKIDPTGASLSNINLLVSMHRGSSSSLSLANLYIVEIGELGLNDFFSAALTQFQQSGRFQKSTRNYQGYQINEYTDGETTLAYIFYNNYLIISFSPFLVDDAIRMLEKGRQNEFEKYNRFEQVSGQRLTGAGRLFVNNTQLARLSARMLDNDGLNVDALQWLSSLMHLDVSIEDATIQLAGFSILDTAQSQYLGTFRGVRGAGFEMKNVIPDHAGMVLHISGQDMHQWLTGLKTYWQEHNTKQLSKIGELENKYGFERGTFFDLIDREIGLFIFNTKKAFSREKILCVRHNDEIRVEKLLKELSVKTRGDKEEYLEEFSRRKIRKIVIDDLPERLFGEVFKGFAESYFFVDRNYFFLANSQSALEILISDMDTDATWRRSVETNNLLETANEDAVFSVYTRGNGFWSMVKENLVEDWADFFEDNELAFDQLAFGALQFVNVDDDFYTSLSVHHPGRLIESKKPKKLNLQKQVNLKKKLTSKPFGVRNHHNRTLEMMVQDESKRLNLVTAEGKVPLKIRLKEQIVTPIDQVDYYKNGKLQYLFATPSQVHMIDRTGTYIPGYPVKVPSDQPIKHITLVDYDGSKDYRILVATQKSYYYLLDKAGKRLKGWNPKKLTGSPAMPGTHLRIKKTDYMLFLQANGIVHGLNRKGLGRPGFPLDLKGNISSPLYISKGGSPGTTELVAVNNIGELFEFDLNGKVIRRDQYPRQSMEEKFSLINSHDDQSFVVMKTSKKDITFFRRSLDEMFSIPATPGDMEIQYYNFEKNNEVIVVVDKANRLLYLYSGLGILLHQEPIESDQKIAMLYHENGDKYEIYYVSGSYMKNATINR